MFSRRELLLFPLMHAIFLFTAQPANACSCAGQPTVLQEYQSARIVVITQVVSVERAMDSQNAVKGILFTKMVVEKIFKGPIKAGEEMIFAQGGGADCIWTFGEKDVGQRFLFYLTSMERGQSIWYASTCGRSTRTANAADDLLYLENIEKVRGKTRLSGTLSFYAASAVEGQESTDISLAGKRVRVIGEKKTYELTTNQDGVYEIYDLPPGRYRIEPEIPDTWKIEDSDASREPSSNTSKGEDSSAKERYELVLETGKHAYRDFRFGNANAIRGRVLDPMGRGMKDVCLRLLPAQGKAAQYFYKADCTKTDGSFEIAGVQAGSYIISVNSDGKISSNEPFPTMYYPNALAREDAAVINVGPGHVLDGIDILVPKLHETVTLEGVVLYSDGKPVVRETITFKPDKAEDGLDGSARAFTDSNGLFSIKILKGLQGSLYGEMFTYSGEFKNCPTLEKLIKEGGSTNITLRTNTLEIAADDDVDRIELKYSFPGCIKAK